MNGFKSFADPVTIEFDRGITCVVGPNGSGKSNISDALRWVLGEQSPKMLRGGKMDEVIFAGTDQRKSRGMAEVCLVIDNTDHSLPIDFTEVSITRRMFRSGESEYYINDSQCRLRDIRELIMDTGIGVDGYSLIGQGKIAEIISGKAESRREIFEEAAGIVKYRSKKAETERKLGQTAANLERVNDIISELEVRVEPLKIESEKAKEYLELSAKYKETEINVTLMNIEQTEKDASSLVTEASVLDKQISDEEEKRENLDRNIRQKKQTMEELEKQDYAERDRLLRFNDEINRLKNNIRINEEKLNSSKGECGRLDEETAAIEEKLRREKLNLEGVNSQSEELAERLEAAEKDFNAANARLLEESGKLDSTNKRFENDRNEMYELSMKSSSAGAELASTVRLLETLEERHRQLLSTDPVGSEEKDSLREMDSISSRISELEVKETDLKHVHADLQTRINETTAAIAAQSSKLEDARLRLNAEHTRKKMLKQLEDSYEGYNGAVRFIMKDSGLSGIYGAVGELIAAPRGYETAIETALGARMQNIICRDDRCAEAAVRSLKVNRAGRLTFLPVESLRVGSRRDTSSISGEEGYIGVASDCVNTDDAYRRVVEYLLGGIIIVKSLDNALKMSKKNNGFRFVTLDGDLVNPAGAITGGAYKNNNKTGILDRKGRLNECDKHIFSLEEEMKSASRMHEDLKRKLDELTEKLAKTADAIRSLELEKLNTVNERKALQLRVDQAQDLQTRHMRELERLTEEISSSREMVKKLQAEKDDTDRRIESLRTEAEKLSSETETMKLGIDRLTDSLTQARILAESVRSEKQSLENVINRISHQIRELEEDLGAKNSRKQFLLDDQLEIEKKNSETSAELINLEQENNNKNNILASLKEQRDQLASEVDKLSEDKELLDKRLFEIRTARHDVGSKLDGFNVKIENWKNKLWDEFEISYIQAIEIKKTAFDLANGIKESRRLRNAIKALGDVNVNSIAEYETVSERFEFLSVQKADLDEAVLALNKIIEDTDVKIRSSFKSSFDAISINFESIFTELFGGGKAELRIEGADPLEADIDIIVQPPGKKLQNMNLLSGGEKTMTAIALMFAVLKTKPTPFCVLDEVEAALDEANIERFADYLKKFELIQFVLVTHQKVTMEHANVLYGVTMPEKGISKVLSLKLSDADKLEGLS